jgi:hypothetical protein
VGGEVGGRVCGRGWVVRASRGTRRQEEAREL